MAMREIATASIQLDYVVDGRGIKSQTQYYMFNTGWEPTENESDWRTMADRKASGMLTAPTDTYPYMWCKTVSLWTTGESTVVIELKTVKGGAGPAGPTGPYVPFPRFWDDYPSTYMFESGASGESKKDMVLVKSGSKVYAYACKSRHVKSSTKKPGVSSGWETYWESGAQWDIIATQLLFSELAFVNNLCAQYIRMCDASGNVIFEALGGNVTCNRGTFNDVRVSGTVIAGDESGRHILLDPDDRAMRIFDAAGNQCAVMDGTSYSLGSVLPSGSAVSITKKTLGSISAVGTATKTATNTVDATNSFTLSSPGSLKITVAGSVSMGAADTSTSSDTISAMRSASLAVLVKKGAAVVARVNAGGWAEPATGASTGAQSFSRTFSVALPAGTYTVAFELSARGATATANVSSFTPSVVVDQFLMRVFSNGAAWTKDSNNYLVIIHEASGRMRLLLGGDMIVDNVRQPKVVYAGRVTDSTKTGSTGATKTDILYPGSSSGVTMSKGANAAAGYTLTFPASYGLTPANAIIDLAGFGGVADNADCPAKATVKSISAGAGGSLSIVVWVSDDSSPNFGGFQIKVSK